MNYIKNLNWKIFVIGFIAGLIGMSLSHGGFRLPKQLSFAKNVMAVKSVLK